MKIKASFVIGKLIIIIVCERIKIKKKHKLNGQKTQFNQLFLSLLLYKSLSFTTGRDYNNNNKN